MDLITPLMWAASLRAGTTTTMRLSLYISVLFGVRRLVAALIHRQTTSVELQDSRLWSERFSIRQLTSRPVRGLGRAIAPAPPTVAQPSSASLVSFGEDRQW